MSSESNLPSDLPKWSTVVSRIILFMVIIASAYIICFDIGDSCEQPAGAGQIWWADVPQIEQCYQSLKNK